jgi:hypothetical protein
MIRSFSHTGNWMLVALILTINCNSGLAQGDLLKQLEERSEPATEMVQGTFHTMRLINGQSVETLERGVLDFVISHRFGRLNSGAYNFFGLDDANIRLGLEYGISDRFNVGLGRNSFFKTYDGYLKYKFLRQQEGERSIPVSVVYFSNIAINTLRRTDIELDFSQRLGFTQQILIARKFTEKLSIQLAPTYVHLNLVERSTQSSGTYALGMGGRYRITPGTSLNAEYFHRFNNLLPGTYNAFSIGFDLETGGHVFQLHLTNARAMTETAFIPLTTGNFFGGDIHFGFNITRSFQVR